MKNAFITGLLIIMFIPFSWSQQIAFPGAEGYGKYTKGGRGGVVYQVTSLKDSGKGSLRAAVEASEPRTIIFEVSGNIELESPLSIKNPYITIAGQTAPGDGICLKNHQLSIDADQVIIRYIRVRPGDISGKDYDAIGGRFHKNIILDHVSASWSTDECVSIYRCDSVTIQWCIISESMFQSNHIKGNHGFGGIWGSNYSTYHHNLLAHHSSRNPRWASGVGYNDYRNNVIYNWGYNSCYGGERVEDSYPDQLKSFTVNMVANYYKPGPATAPGDVSYRIASPAYKVGKEEHGLWYVSDNVMLGNSEVTADNWKGIHTRNDSLAFKKLKLDAAWPAMPIKQELAEDAYFSVLQYAGAFLPKRDKIDERIIQETTEGNASYEGSWYKKKKKMADTTLISGIIDSQNDVGGWPELESTPAPKDTDHDGMPDTWEIDKKLNPKDASDGNKDRNGNGYTNVEEYINKLVEDGISLIKARPNH